MSDASNDSISIGDLFAAFGAAPATGDNANGSANAKQSGREASAAFSQDDSDVIDVMAALGITPSSSMRISAATTKERQERSSAREEQIREQQIRSQQWQRELEEQQRRRQIQAEREVAVEEPVVGQESQPKKSGFGEDTTRIAEPSFLDRRASRDGAGGQDAPVHDEVPFAAQSVSDSETQQPAAPAMPVDFADAQAPRPGQPVQQMGVPVEGAPIPIAGQVPPPTQPALQKSAIRPLMESQMVTDTAPVAQKQAAQDASEPVLELDKSQPTASQSAQAVKPLAQSEVPEQGSMPMPPAGTPQGSPTVSLGAAQPSMPMEAPMAMPTIHASEQQNKEKHGPSKGNVLGVILIVVALICAALTVLLLTGTIDANTFSELTSGNTPAADDSARRSSKATVIEENSSSGISSGELPSYAVYSYVVRGTDGGTYQATETAEFSPDGTLMSSSIVIDVPDESQAQGLLEQLRSDFGESVTDSGTREGEVYLTINIDRDDLDVDSYTELLSSNMAEFKVLETGTKEE